MQAGLPMETTSSAALLRRISPPAKHRQDDPQPVMPVDCTKKNKTIRVHCLDSKLDKNKISNTFVVFLFWIFKMFI